MLDRSQDSLTAVQKPISRNRWDAAMASGCPPLHNISGKWVPITIDQITHRWHHP